MQRIKLPVPEPESAENEESEEPEAKDEFGEGLEFKLDDIKEDEMPDFFQEQSTIMHDPDLLEDDQNVGNE